jgi:hypothetical protein
VGALDSAAVPPGLALASAELVGQAMENMAKDIPTMVLNRKTTSFVGLRG